MGLSPLYRPAEEGDGLVRVRAHRQALSAVTRYKVLDSSSGCSLVELQPITGIERLPHHRIPDQLQSETH